MQNDHRVKITKDGYAIIEGDTHISKWVEETGRLDHDQNTLPLILPHIQPGMTVVDGGAFIGDHTLAYLKAVGPTGTVIAFECNPLALECLRHNCPAATIFDFALSDTSKAETLLVGGNAGASHLLRSGVPPNTQALTVKCMPLDFLKLEKLDLMKLDIEGFEYAAIEGALETINRCRPIMVLELNQCALKRQSRNPEELLGLIATLNYKVTPLMEGHTFTDPQTDILCVPIEK